MAKNLTAVEINQKYQVELKKLLEMQKATDQQQDLVIDLHLKYVQAVAKNENWK